MNSSKNIMIAVIAFVLIGGAGFALTQSKDGNDGNNETNETGSSDVMEKEGSDSDDAMEKEGEESMEKHDEAMMEGEEKMEKDGDKMMEEGAMKKSEQFITTADYNSDKSAYEDSDKVYFFHASWCPICKGIEKELEADLSQIPTGVTIIKADYDKETDLRKKYGVTTQYTFVQFDDDGNQVKKWSATSASKAISGIML